LAEPSVEPEKVEFTTAVPFTFSFKDVPEALATVIHCFEPVFGSVGVVHPETLRPLRSAIVNTD
jgi:hypothetical protein